MTRPLALDKHNRLKVSEAHILRACRTAFLTYGAQVHRLQAGGATFRGRHYRLEPAGTPDLLAVWPRQSVYCETKASDGTLRPAQRLRHAQLQAEGFTVLVPHDARDVLDWLAANDPRRGAPPNQRLRPF
jgi:hypothetical protein